MLGGFGTFQEGEGRKGEPNGRGLGGVQDSAQLKYLQVSGHLESKGQDQGIRTFPVLRGRHTATASAAPGQCLPQQLRNSPTNNSSSSFIIVKARLLSNLRRPVPASVTPVNRATERWTGQQCTQPSIKPSDATIGPP